MTAAALELRPSEHVNLAGQETGRGHLSNTSVSMQLNCLRKWGWHYGERLETIERPRPLGMGKAFQKAIELADPRAGAELVREGVQVLSQADEDKLRIEEAIVAAAARLYLDRWGSPPGEEREVEYRVRLRSPWTGAPSRTFDLLGYADGVVDHGDYLELVENKFVGRVDEVSVRKLPLDRQVSLACYGLWRAFGKPVRQVRYRFTRKPSIKRREGRGEKKTGAESVDQFVARLEADYADPGRRDFYSREEALFRTDQDLVLIEAELWDWAEQLRNAKHRDFFARNTSHCHDYGGCQFIPLCVGDPDARSLYRVRPERELEQEAQAK